MLFIIGIAIQRIRHRLTTTPEYRAMESAFLLSAIDNAFSAFIIASTD